jgi:hypothetical protein
MSCTVGQTSKCHCPAMNRNSSSIERRRFLSALASTAMGLLAGGAGRAQTNMSALLAVAYEDAGRQIASDFIGLSYESAILNLRAERATTHRCAQRWNAQFSRAHGGNEPAECPRLLSG